MAKKVNTTSWHDAPLCNKWIAWSTIVAAGLALLLSVQGAVKGRHPVGKGDQGQKAHGKPAGH